VHLIAFDVYGTLVDPTGIVDQLSKRFGAQASSVARLWREKTIEYSFRRALMSKYADFDECTAQALHHVSMQLGVKLDESDERALLDSYLRLPAFPDVKSGLETLRRVECKIVALTNGTERSVHTLLQYAGVSDYFSMILSAATIRTFKPDPAVYALLQRVGDIPRDQCWLVSANPFDVIGAKAHGLKAAWVRRDPTTVFDPWEFSPDVVVGTLTELSGELESIGDK
jgi:2-haloacid dehalogenase